MKERKEPLLEPPLVETSHAGRETSLPSDSGLPKKPFGLGRSFTHAAPTVWLSSAAAESNSKYGANTSCAAVTTRNREVCREQTTVSRAGAPSSGSE
eukprot:1714413-Prymnesium_polylepis.1